MILIPRNLGNRRENARGEVRCMFARACTATEMNAVRNQLIVAQRMMALRRLGAAGLWCLSVVAWYSSLLRRIWRGRLCLQIRGFDLCWLIRGQCGRVAVLRLIYKAR